ncbi:methyl-accepting chemotaxis protein [Fontibacillus sp. BL9]|uniref:methyl-accepting chemotaxis protein n=1 Tax=Fontibacillus sp. BL9 TaxID=3389971 RepID=UPI0039788BBE
MKFIKNLKIASKISFLSASLFIFLLLTGIIGMLQISNVNDKLEELNNSRLIPIVQLEQIKSDMEATRTLASTYMDASSDEERTSIQTEITTYRTSIQQALEAYHTDASVKNVLSAYDAYGTAMDQFLERFATNALGPEGGEAPAPAESGAANNEGAASGDIPENGNQPAGTLVGGPPAEMTSLDQTKSDLITTMDSWIDLHIKTAQQTYESSKTVFRSTLITMSALILIGAVITAILTLFITRMVVVPLTKVTAKLRDIAESNGDLTGRLAYQSKDELGDLSRSFDSFIARLQAMIAEMIHSSVKIYASSERLSQATGTTTSTLEGISTTIREISEGTSENAAVAEETSASLAEMAKYSESTALASTKTTESGRKARLAAQDGAAKIKEIIGSIQEIDTSANLVSDTIHLLNDSSGRIGEITALISGISAQTNLLALNAAIEAAHAGEAGKGFAVVADEIRKLADEANSAAKEIAGLVSDNQLKSATAVKSAQNVTGKVKLGSNIAAEAGESIGHILNSIQEIAVQIEQIEYDNNRQALSAREMDAAIQNIACSTGEIADGTEQINDSVKQQLGMMTEIDDTADHLAQMAKKLKEMTAGFTV